MERERDDKIQQEETDRLKALEKAKEPTK